MGKVKDKDLSKEVKEIIEGLTRENEILKSQIKDIKAQVNQKGKNKTEEEVKNFE